MADLLERLRRAGVPTPEADARWLTGLGLAPDELEPLVRRREGREPLQLILGRWPFRTVELELEAGVFVPRPETEAVAEVAIQAAAGARLVVDLCTGSGAIASAVAAETAVPRIIATDRSPLATALARRNLARWPDRVEVRTGDLLAPVAPEAGEIDVLVANPPYLPAADRWEPEVARHDPRDALVGGPDGHELVDCILAGAGRWLRPGGSVIVEIDDRRGDDAVRGAARADLVDVALVPDLAGRDRAVRGRRRG